MILVLDKFYENVVKPEVEVRGNIPGSRCSNQGSEDTARRQKRSGQRKARLTRLDDVGCQPCYCPFEHDLFLGELGCQGMSGPKVEKVETPPSSLDPANFDRESAGTGSETSRCQPGPKGRQDEQMTRPEGERLISWVEWLYGIRYGCIYISRVS